MICSCRGLGREPSLTQKTVFCSVHVGSAPPAKKAHKLKLKFWQTRIKGCAFGNQRTYQQSQHDLIRVFYIFTRPTSEVENSNIILLLPYYLPRNYIGPNVEHGLLISLYSFLYALLGLCVLILMTAMKVGPVCFLKVTFCNRVLLVYTFGSFYIS